MIANNLRFGEWSQVFEGAKMTATLLDRVTHHFEIFETGQRKLETEAKDVWSVALIRISPRLGRMLRGTLGGGRIARRWWVINRCRLACQAADAFLMPFDWAEHSEPIIWKWWPQAIWTNFPFRGDVYLSRLAGAVTPGLNLWGGSSRMAANLPSFRCLIRKGGMDTLGF